MKQISPRNQGETPPITIEFTGKEAEMLLDLMGSTCKSHFEKIPDLESDAGALANLGSDMYDILSDHVKP